MKIKFTFEFFISLFIVALMNPPAYTVMVLFSAVIHEIGHIICFMLLKIRNVRLNTGLFGGTFEFDDKLISYKKDFLICISGGLANLVFCIIAIFLLNVRYSDELFFMFFSNLALALFNLLPIRGLDGGGALFAIMCRYRNISDAEKTVAVTTVLFTLVLTSFCFYLMGHFDCNVSLSAICAFLIFDELFYLMPSNDHCLKTS